MLILYKISMMKSFRLTVFNGDFFRKIGLTKIYYWFNK